VGFTQLAVIGLVALLGPLLAYPKGWHLPVVLGELVAGIVMGRAGVGYLHSSDPTFTLLANVGFGLMMFVAGTHVPVRDPQIRPALRAGLVRALVVGGAAAVLGWVIAHAFDVHHTATFAVLMASSSAALVLPVIDSLGLGGPQVIGLLPQVAIADAACIVALPLAIDPAHALRAAGGATAVIAGAAAVGVLLWRIERRGIRHRVHRISERRQFAIELRVQLIVLFALAALAVQTHVSVMLAGFAFGIVVAAIGEPRRLAHQLFALGEGFLTPLYFVWLGASLNVRTFGTHPRMILLGVALGAGAIVTHLVARAFGQHVSLDLLSAAQLGVPVAAATVGGQLGVLRPGEGSALILGALVTIGFAVLGGALATRAGLAEEPGPSSLPTVTGAG